MQNWQQLSAGPWVTTANIIILSCKVCAAVSYLRSQESAPRSLHSLQMHRTVQTYLDAVFKDR